MRAAYSICQHVFALTLLGLAEARPASSAIFTKPSRPCKSNNFAQLATVHFCGIPRFVTRYTAKLPSQWPPS
jgi:hypothetical protein